MDCHLGFQCSPCFMAWWSAASTSPLQLTCLSPVLSSYLHSGRFFTLSFLVDNVSYCFYVHRSIFSLPLYRFNFLFSVVVLVGLFLSRFLLFLGFSFPLISMSASGEGSNLVNTGDVDPSSVVEGSSVAQSPSMSPGVIADIQRQIKENNALVHSLREELRRGQLAGSSLSQTSTSVYSSRELTDGPLLSEESRVPEDSFSLYALDSSFQGPNVRGTHFKSPLNIYLDVEPYLSHPQVDSHTACFSEDVSYVSDLLQLSKRKDITPNFCNMSEQLLSAEGEAWTISFLLLSLSVSHWLRELNNKIRGSHDAEVLRQSKDCLQACHKGMVGFEVFSASRHKIFPSSSYIFVIMLSSLRLKCWMGTTTYWPQQTLWFPLRLRNSRVLNSWPGVLLVCCLAFSILMLPPPYSSSSSWRWWARVIRSLVTTCPDVTQPQAVTGEGYLPSC